MATYAFVQEDGQAAEVKRLCATDDTPPLALLSGDIKTPAQVQVGDVLRDGFLGGIRVDSITTA